MYIEDIPEGNLRYGYTTGACATAATKAALIGLITGNIPDEVTIELPVKKNAVFKISHKRLENDYAEASVLKDGGDDPDVTTGLFIYSRVYMSPGKDIKILGGKGIGVVTREGLPVRPGNSAINPVPMRMIRGTAMKVLNDHGINNGLSILIYAPGGNEVARRTCNPKLGIIGGISILGTTGIVTPFSTSSWKASIVLALRVAIKNSIKGFVFTTGGRSDSEAKKILNGYPEESFIEIGDFAGFSVRRAMEAGANSVTIVGMPGKMSKLAMGCMDLHAHSSSVDFNFLSDIAKKIKMDKKLIEKIGNSNTVSEVMQIINYNNEFINYLKNLIIQRLTEYTNNRLKIDAIIIRNDNGV
ncbi:cobalt-precorrin-5B (C(1))-methyltransferase CbiD [Acidiplasma sp.]|uniref:cobalt-precorrin-5B (C(1))-methyltransferase CbiD n=1 Tax=Acidiplasma sp. TaxID=1872114 RepID=UPI00258CD7C5|nr:cobalt-precorrin-5B (C(1))-methyltransferase CbiD [Acidiplasma sp.]